MHGLMMGFQLPLMFTVAVNLDFHVIKRKAVVYAEVHEACLFLVPMLYHTLLVTEVVSRQGIAAWEPVYNGCT